MEPGWQWRNDRWDYWDGQRWLRWDGGHWSAWDGHEWSTWDGQGWTPEPPPSVTTPPSPPPSVTTPASSPPPAPRRGTGSAGLIIGILVACGILFVAVVVIALVVDAKNPSQTQARPQTPAPTTAAPSGSSIPKGGEVQAGLKAIDKYWSSTMPSAFGIQWLPPSKTVPFTRPDEQGPTCNGFADQGQFAAYYCPLGSNDFIAWDESLMASLYEQYGPTVTWLVLSHELGHSVQALLQVNYTEAKRADFEVQADCFAGAFEGWAQQRGLLPADAEQTATDFFMANGDLQGNTAEEYVQAYQDGFAHGAQYCTRNYG